MSQVNPDLQLIANLNPSSLDEILFYLAFTALRTHSHRHGTFLDAAATAAKCAIYATYREEGENLRMTGHLHHLEPKRVKAIVQEIQGALHEGKLLKTLGSQEPDYLIQLPHVWLEHYPQAITHGQSPPPNLTSEEWAYFQEKLPPNRPPAQIINSFQFSEIIEFLHHRSQAKFPQDRRSPLSEALGEHIRRRLLHSQTVMRLDNPWGLPFYVLTRTYYSPASNDERHYICLGETARYFRLMQQWADNMPGVMRILEELDIPPEQLAAAQAELDQLLRHWADKYHQQGGQPHVVQMVFGLKDQ